MNTEDEMKRMDGESCVAEPFLKFIAQEWTSHIILVLARRGTLRFGELRRALPAPISARVLSARLKDLEAAGYVARQDLSDKVRRVEYSLTEAGRAVDSALQKSEALLRQAAQPPRQPVE